MAKSTNPKRRRGASNASSTRATATKKAKPSGKPTSNGGRSNNGGGRRRSPRPHLELSRVPVKAEWLPEPTIRFAGGFEATDPKVGISLWGPASAGTSRHPAQTRVGFIGTAHAVDNARKLLGQIDNGIDGGDTHHPFPGIADSFGFDLVYDDDSIVQPITVNEQRDLLDTKPQRRRFEDCLAILNRKTRLLAESDHPPTILFVVLDDDLYRKCRVTDYRDGGQVFHRDLRKAYKAVAMQHRLPTQILLESTTRQIETRRSLDHETEVAWNLTNAMYFKAGGLPWSPTGLHPGSCFVGVSFARPLGSASTLFSSVVQAFDEQGDGLVLRGHDFHWDEARDGRAPHLPADTAAALIDMVLERYKSERGQLPRRVVVHKSSRYEPAEREGFQDALRLVDRHDLVALARTSDWRLVRAGKYPPLRGTVLTTGDHSMLYTTGYIPDLGYDAAHVPAPIKVTDHFGDTPHRDLLTEVLALTKMNWNSANFAESSPVTLRFAELVGGILREHPRGTPMPQYRYYI